eukprot:TRINITY_DN8927_c1_g3_i2.p1 TRINITY_DN8927_c1_g3~~TRINITY_DN8927_c1_g3_i2.p1  ORF type:complete len:326 (+),score=32.52 TRINITY_DN8927_c1_g3_i2:17-994(+)
MPAGRKRPQTAAENPRKRQERLPLDEEDGKMVVFIRTNDGCCKEVEVGVAGCVGDVLRETNGGSVVGWENAEPDTLLSEIGVAAGDTLDVTPCRKEVAKRRLEGKGHCELNRKLAFELIDADDVESLHELLEAAAFPPTGLLGYCSGKGDSRLTLLKFLLSVSEQYGIEVTQEVLHVAVKADGVEAAAALLEFGLDVNSSGPPLLVSAGSREMAALLLRHQADPNTRTKQGITPLIHHLPSPTIFDTLLPHCDINLPDFQGRTPLIHAVLQSSVHAVTSLLQAGAKRDFKDTDGLAPWDHAMRVVFLDRTPQALAISKLLKPGQV